MKKFFTLLTTLCLATTATFAQSFAFVKGDKVIETGSTLILNEIEEPIPGIMYQISNADLRIKNVSENDLVVSVTLKGIDNYKDVLLCGGGSCVGWAGDECSVGDSKNPAFKLAPGATFDPQIHITLASADEKKSATVKITANDYFDDEDATTITLVFTTDQTALASVQAGNKPYVAGRNFHYNFNKTAARTLQVYNLSGAMVMSKSLQGNSGTLSLESLPQGIYLYKVNGENICGKVIIK